MELLNPKHFRTSTEWRRWLARNHAKEQGVWLVHRKKGSRKKCINHQEAVDEALCFGWIDSKLRSFDKDAYILRYTPRRMNSVWSKANRTAAQRLVKEGRMTEFGLRKIEEAKRSGRWATAYSSKNEPLIPPDSKAALIRNPKAWREYQALSNTRKLAFVFWLNNAKKDTTRKSRISDIVRKAESGRADLP